MQRQKESDEDGFLKVEVERGNMQRQRRAMREALRIEKPLIYYHAKLSLGI